LRSIGRAIAIGERDGPRAALTSLDAIAPDLDDFYLMHAARGTMPRRLEKQEAARVALERASLLAPREADRRLLERQIEELAE
jgi:RNA polymerase sigma-70 factor, ECF subfamily